MFDFRNVRFLKSTTKGGPALRCPKFVVLGRSNVGKSSLLNDLFQKKGLVKTSTTPGKTRLLNFFLIDEKLLCVDLPGYGYAKVSEKMQRAWGEGLDAYLSEADLNFVLLLLDIRRTPSELDLQMIQWLQARGMPTIVVLTKVDKVSKNEKRSQTAKITQYFDWEHVHYSTTKREGRPQLLAKICHALAEKNPVHLP